ncbi:MAG TPA: chlorite dismutase family protein [Terriglobales bacterium]|nr:chlorite dismutase family protein [Terriglobales bacterium]
MAQAIKSEPQSSMPGGQESRRQLVSFSFYKVMPEWRRLAHAERDEHRREAAEVLRRWSSFGELRLLTYSTVGMRADCDMVLWRICYSLECLQSMSRELLATRLGGYLETKYSYLAMTKRMQYAIKSSREHDDERGFVKAGKAKYLFVYPLRKTRDWYQLVWEERQRIINEYIQVIDEFPRVRFHIAYSFGIDDPEYVLAYESDYPEDFLDMVQQLRDTENSAYTAVDTPRVTCVQTSVEEMLERLG